MLRFGDTFLILLPCAEATSINISNDKVIINSDNIRVYVFLAFLTFCIIPLDCVSNITFNFQAAGSFHVSSLFGRRMVVPLLAPSSIS